MKRFGGERGARPRLGPLVGAPSQPPSHVAPEQRVVCPGQNQPPDANSHCSRAESWKSLMKVEQTSRTFFTDHDEDKEGETDSVSEIECLTMPPRFWRHKPTGRKGLDKFRKTVDFILIARQLFSRSNLPSLTQEESILFFLDIPSTSIELPLLPSPNSLAAIKFGIASLRTSKEPPVCAVKSILETPPPMRTDDQIAMTSRELQAFSKFTGYPSEVQRGICQYGWYASYEPHRVLCRQGQEAEIYYFILSGVAISRSMDKSENAKDNRRRERAAFLRKGDTIGETEILQNCDRKSTVISKEHIEVLGVDRKIFLDLFDTIMLEGDSNISFLKKLDLLADFPTDLLQAHQFACSQHSFRRGAVIVSNSNESEWIYVIKEGSCQVYKAIKSRGSLKETKKTRSRRARSDEDIRDLAKKECTALYLPSIASPRQANKNKPQQDRFGRRRSISDGNLTTLPAITAGDEKRLVGRHVSNTSDSGYTTVNEEVAKPKKKKHSCVCQPKIDRKVQKKLAPLPSKEPPIPTKAFAKLDVLTTKGVFGLHSLIYEDTPSMTLVSNGSTCILVSKQFLSDHLTAKVVNSLRYKLPRYPTLANLQSALDDQASWSNYKQKVVHDTIIP